MRIRGIVVATLAVAASLAVPATAKGPQHTVWEVVPARGGVVPDQVSVHAVVKAVGQPEVLAFAHLRPQGRGYVTNGVTVTAVGFGATTWRTYGTPAPISLPACPDAEVCGGTEAGRRVETVYTFYPQLGSRLLVVAPSGRTTVRSLNSRWTVRKTTLGVRTRLADASEATGLRSGDTTLEHFRSASLPGGRYGSEAFAYVPCDTGQWSLADGAAFRTDMSCAADASAAVFGSTQRASATWTAGGDVVGRAAFPVRLLVIDHPRRP